MTLIVPHERTERVEGVHVRGIPAPANGKERLTQTGRRVYDEALRQPADAVFHIHDFELCPWGFALKARGRRVVYDVHEDTPLMMLYQHWIPAPLRRPVSWFTWGTERVAERLFDGIIAAEPEIHAKFNHPTQALVRNYPIADELMPKDPVPYLERPPRIAYVGTITRVRGMEEILRAVGLVAGDRRVEFKLAGSFHPAELEQELAALEGWEQTDYLGWLSRPEVADLFGTSRMGVITPHPVRKHLGFYPTKLFEYMSAGLPVIVSDFPQLRAIVEEVGCGLLVDPLDPEAIANAVRMLLDDPIGARAMGQRGREAVLDRFNWEHEGQRLVDFYRKLIGSFASGN